MNEIPDDVCPVMSAPVFMNLVGEKVIYVQCIKGKCHMWLKARECCKHDVGRFDFIKDIV
jgi:hypothetical protein